MSLIYVEQDVIDQFPDTYKLISNTSTEKFVTWIINSKYRKAVYLKQWIADQVPLQRPSVQHGNTDDETVINVLKYVAQNVVYKSDAAEWKMDDYWQRGDETLSLKTGDCEDGAILAYLLCRDAGIPANRLLIVPGYVDNPIDSTDVVGHCWLAYRPSNYPFNWVFLDWCYWPDMNQIGYRTFYYIDNQSVYAYNSSGLPIKSKYHEIWFGFNEEESYISLQNNIQ